MFGLYHFFYLSLRELLVKHFEMRILSLVCAALLLCSSRMSANNKLDLKAVTDGSLSAQTISGITPIEGSDLYTQISSDGKRVVRYSFKTGKQTDVLFDIDDTQGEKLNRFDGYILSPDRPFREQTQIGPFGIAEPDSSCPLFVPEENRFPLLICVPAIAFSETGIRLGRGAGYYDRYCERLARAALKMPLVVYAGLCRDFQIVEKVPYEKHDLRVQFLISEGGIRPVKALPGKTP